MHTESGLAWATLQTHTDTKQDLIEGAPHLVHLFAPYYVSKLEVQLSAALLGSILEFKQVDAHSSIFKTLSCQTHQLSID